MRANVRDAPKAGLCATALRFGEWTDTVMDRARRYEQPRLAVDRPAAAQRDS